MADIPSQLSFEHMLSHLFPGFFTALTVFMAIDIVSPLNLSQFILKDLNTMLGFLGFIFLVGTILGVIIDGLHHRLIELYYFSTLEKDINKGKSEHISIKKISEHIIEQMGCFKGKDERCNVCELFKEREYGLLKTYLVFDINNVDKFVALHDYLKKSVYCYYEFYANTFIAMFLFAFIAPMYMVKILNVDFFASIFIGAVLLFLSIICLDFAWMAYKRWIYVLYFSFCRCLEGNTLNKCQEGHSFEISWK